MDQNLEKLVELLEKDREIFQMLRQCPYEILRRFEVKDYEADQFVLNQGEIHNRFYIIASGYVDIYVYWRTGNLQTDRLHQPDTVAWKSTDSGTGSNVLFTMDPDR